MKRYLPVLMAALAGAVGLIIRRIFGLDVLKELLPYLVAAPSAYILVRLLQMARRSQRKATTTNQRINEIYAGALCAVWIVMIGIGPFQHWMSHSLWGVMISLALLVLLLLPHLIFNRLTLGTWLIKHQPTAESEEK